MTAAPAARLLDASVTYGDVLALDHVSMDVRRGALTAVMGPSGSGKSTMLRVLAGLERVTSGSVCIDGVDLSSLDDRALTIARRTKVAMIFQSYNLLPQLDLESNIKLPLRIAGREVEGAWFAEITERLRLSAALLRRKPGEMSGGERQRGAAARAFMTRPAVILADEPTGNLDRRAAGELLDVLVEGVRDLGQTVLLVTHDPTAAARAERVVGLSDGRVIAEMDGPSALDLARLSMGVD